MSNLVLIAENETNIIESLSFLLKRAGYEVAVALNGAEVLEKIHELRPKVVILDVMMPEYNGFEVLEKLNSDPIFQTTKFLMLTAKGQEADKNKAMELGADRYITKPFSNKEVIDCVEELQRELA
ncbi:MAG: response regulator transcription factor [Methyloligellaceae bacterium]